MKAKKLIKKIFSLEKVILAILFCFLASVCLFLIVPLIWGLITSFKTPVEYTVLENVIGLPENWTIENYLNVFKDMYIDVDGFKVTIPEMYLNSILYAVGGGFVQAFVTCIVAYTIARIDKPFSKFLYAFVLMVSSLQIVGALPSEIQMSKTLGLYDSMLGMYLMKCHFLNVYFLFFYANAKAIPKTMLEAAEIDGANEWQIFFKIGFPQMRGIFLTVFLLFAIAGWNDYQATMVYLPSYPTISYGVFKFFMTTNNLTSAPRTITGCMFLLVPMLVLYITCNKRLLQNVRTGGIKE